MPTKPRVAIEYKQTRDCQFRTACNNLREEEERYNTMVLSKRDRRACEKMILLLKKRKMLLAKKLAKVKYESDSDYSE